MRKKRTAKQGQPAQVGGYDERKWRVREAYDTIKRAAEHSQDKRLMRDVRKHAGEQAKAALRIAKMEKKDPRV